MHHNDYIRAYRRTTVVDIEAALEDPDEIWFEWDARKRANLKRATPPWVNREEIRKIYMEAIRLSRTYRTEMVVMHVHPIRHRNVCGLHVPWNLKVVSRSYATRWGRKLKP